MERRRHEGAYGTRVVRYYFILVCKVEKVGNLFLLQRCRARTVPQSVRSSEEKGFIKPLLCGNITSGLPFSYSVLQPIGQTKTT